MGPTPVYGARAEKPLQNADFAMKQTNICRLSGDIKNIEKSCSSIPCLKASKLEKSMLSCGKLFQILTIRSANTGDAVHVNVRGAAQDVPVRLVRSTVSMDATYITMSSQKLVTLANRSDVIARFRWTRFATPEAERQHRTRSDYLHFLDVICPFPPHF